MSALTSLEQALFFCVNSGVEMTLSFEELGLEANFVEAVEQLGYQQPTPIQLAAIPALLEGRNVLGQAQTGTGKTAAFALPLLQTIQPGLGRVQALVLAPTRELAIQVAEATLALAQMTTVRVLAVYGGQSYDIQKRQLRRGVDVVVGTPGRLLDLARQEVLDLSQVHYLVLDEADEMLEMGFIEEIDAILAQLPVERQSALFSATLPEAIRKLAEKYISDPHQISINPSRKTVEETEQSLIFLREEDKIPALARLLEVEPVKSALVFARTKIRAQELADALIDRGYPAEALHGDLSQSRREYVLNRFRQNQVTILVATDVAARGLDINNVSHVFNYDAPQDGDDYVHRIGRTGRAGRTGTAITFFTPRERIRRGRIEGYTRQTIAEHRIPTLEDILIRRDEALTQRVEEQMIQAEYQRERELIAAMVQNGYDPLEIAAASLRLARSGEIALPSEDVQAITFSPKRRAQEAAQPARYPEAKANGGRKTSVVIDAPREPDAFVQNGGRSVKGPGGRKETAHVSAQDESYPSRKANSTPSRDEVVVEKLPRKDHFEYDPRQDRKASKANGAAPDGKKGRGAGETAYAGTSGKGKRVFAGFEEDKKSRRSSAGFVRLWMNLGEAHGLRPKDVVGAIAGEAGIPGKAIGEIDIRREHSFVDVSEKHVRRVLQASGGNYKLCGRPVQLKISS